jgi:hypothetical protein
MQLICRELCRLNGITETLEARRALIEPDEWPLDSLTYDDKERPVIRVAAPKTVGPVHRHVAVNFTTPDCEPAAAGRTFVAAAISPTSDRNGSSSRAPLGPRRWYRFG